jgi:N6-L-threonylcarbamoyladenine synthase
MGAIQIRDILNPQSIAIIGASNNSKKWSNEIMRNIIESGYEGEIYPSPGLCTDNAAMIGCAAYYRYINGTKSDFTLNAIPNLSLE